MKVRQCEFVIVKVGRKKTIFSSTPIGCAAPRLPSCCTALDCEHSSTHLLFFLLLLLRDALLSQPTLPVCTYCKARFSPCACCASGVRLSSWTACTVVSTGCVCARGLHACVQVFFTRFPNSPQLRYTAPPKFPSLYLQLRYSVRVARGDCWPSVRFFVRSVRRFFRFFSPAASPTPESSSSFFAHLRSHADTCLRGQCTVDDGGDDGSDSDDDVTYTTSSARFTINHFQSPLLLQDYGTVFYSHSLRHSHQHHHQHHQHHEQQLMEITKQGFCVASVAIDNPTTSVSPARQLYCCSFAPDSYSQ